jgi:hypothetical protein
MKRPKVERLIGKGTNETMVTHLLEAYSAGSMPALSHSAGRDGAIHHLLEWLPVVPESDRKPNVEMYQLYQWYSCTQPQFEFCCGM